MASTRNPESENPDALDADHLAGAKASPIDRLSGLLRDEMAEYGGGEAFLKWLRTDPKPQDQCEGSMEIRYTLTLDEFREGYGLMLRNTTFQHRLSYWFRSWLGPVLGLWILCCAFVILAGNGSFALVLVLCVVGVAALVAPLRFRMTLRSLSAAESGS